VGYEYDAVVKQLFYNKQASPYSDCVEDVDNSQSSSTSLFKSTLKLVGRYNQKYCLQLCSQRYLIAKCQCYDVTLPKMDSTTSPCDLNQALTCMQDAYVGFYSSDDASSCFTECPQECNSVYFGLKLSRADFPSPFYGELLLNYSKNNPNNVRNFSSYAQIKRSILAVNIYYDDVSYTQVDESPARTFEQLIADIGGIVGLCIGGSLLSLVELFELAYRLVYVSVKSDETTNKKSMSQNKVTDLSVEKSNLSSSNKELESASAESSRAGSRAKLVTVDSSKLDLTLKSKVIKVEPVKAKNSKQNLTEINVS
jgi:hypothetical protein